MVACIPSCRLTNRCTRMAWQRFFEVVLPVESVYNQNSFAGPGHRVNSTVSVRHEVVTVFVTTE